MTTTILLTGATGFLGKVVLEELFRCRDDHPFEKVIVLIRPQGELIAEERFRTQVASSLCFSRLPKDWTSSVDVVSADLSSERCGIEAASYEQVRTRTTHIIHCAGSVAFAPSAACETISDNIDGAQHVLGLAQACPKLQRLVHTSTAYRMPHVNEPVEETISSLESAGLVLSLLEEGKTSTEDILKFTGHTNLYTLAKCLAEHVLLENRGSLPLTIVRPSIISASQRYPFPGWIDSFAALAGMVAAIGTGCLHVLNANPDTVVDVVPVDVVARSLIHEALAASSTQQDEARFVHVVSGIAQGLRISDAHSVVVNYFTRHPAIRKPRLWHVGSKTSLAYQVRHVVHHRLPRGFAKGMAKLRRNEQQLRRLEKAKQIQTTANTSLAHFTHHTYDFRAATPCLEPDFNMLAYLEVVCQGVRVYLLERDPTKAIFAGKMAEGCSSDLAWSRQQPGSTLVTTVAAAVVKKTFAKIFDQVTFDEHSFLEAAETASDKKKTMVIVPTHRSYLDSVVCSYLFFTRPELDIRMPRILASHEFAQIPVVGWMCRQFRTVFVVRGRGRPDEQLDVQLEGLVRAGDNLLFFVEGQRSRTGETLPGKRGVLRSLQSVGEELVVLPLAITYDQIPEASAFAKEMKGGSKQLASLKGLSKWMVHVICGRVKLGNVHVECGAPLVLQPSTDVYVFTARLTTALSQPCHADKEVAGV